TSIHSGTDLEVLVRTRGAPDEEITADLLYTYEGGEEALVKAMSPVKKNLYVCRIEDVRAPLAYHVNIGGSESKAYNVTVVKPPVIVQWDVFYDFPSYTSRSGWEDRVDKDTNGDVRAPVGTVARLRFHADKPIRKGHIQLSNGNQVQLIVQKDPTQADVKIRVDKDTVYSVQVVDLDDIANRDPRENKIIALPDRAPIIEFRKPAKDIAAAVGSTLKLILNARDDYGVTQVALFARRGKDGAQKRIKNWTDFADPRRVPLTFSWDLSLSEYGYETDDEVFYYAVARDNHADVSGSRELPKPQESRTGEFKIRIEDKAQVAKDKADAISNWETALRRVLEDQLAARNQLDAAGREEDLVKLRKAGAALGEAQTNIFTRTVTIAKGIQVTDEQAQAVKDAVTALAYGEMAQCVKLCQGVRLARDAPQVEKTFEAVGGSQDKIIAVIRRLLNILPELAEDVNRDELEDDEVDDFPEEEEEALKDLLKNLKEMVREKKKNIETTDELAKLPMEDFTPEEEKKLEGAKAIEEKWSQFLKAKISDLSKMQDQDFANGTVLDELIEIHSEVEVAKDALSKGATEIATALEDNGVGLAESLTKQLEKWLPDSPDRDRWQMEEPLTDGYETPMAELPKELEDLVGDLMEEEEDLQQDVEDATSAWADSMDAAGWDAMDGPISNFAANGVTGNRLPNTSELNGRSGEGRQGKSTGEFVSNEFTGKGGRRTETRLTPEAFQKGQIKDTSSSPPGGATGGGKAGGSSGEGLEGPVPPDIKMEMKGFAIKQAQLRNKAEKIALKFEVLNYPPVFEPVVKDMRVLEAALNNGRYMEARRHHNVMLKNLKDTRMFLEGQLTLDEVRSPTLPAHLQEEILSAASASVPEEFKEYVKGYYEAISKAR
ncbi:hypothetical protein HQ560_12635, partial [bacterium]|nr:hypothetical protein [bacterium]